jgi:hydrogenase maturation protease
MEMMRQGRQGDSGAPVVVTPPVLLIGYGNTLRSDDGAGPRVAETVAAWDLDDVRVEIAHQLTPELAEAVSRARTVLFVDASADATLATVTVTPVAPGGDVIGHAADPASLLGLAGTVFGKCPPAWLIVLPAQRFDFGETLSPAAERGVTKALELIRNLIGAVRGRGTL